MVEQSILSYSACVPMKRTNSVRMSKKIRATSRKWLPLMLKTHVIGRIESLPQFGKISPISLLDSFVPLVEGVGCG